ncbi:MAG: MFS transporter [Clostridia bacterium]|nr:MFS transporter [Clostridia bacterium]
MRRRYIGLLYLISCGLYWMGVSLTMGMAVPYLSFHGFNNTQMGLILSGANVACIVISLSLASLADRGGAKAILPILISGLLAAAVSLAALIFISLPGPLFCAAYILLAASVLAVGPLYIKLYHDLERTCPLPAFGLFRAFGSLCFAGMSFLSGTVLKRSPVAVIPVINILCVLPQLLCLTALYPVLSRAKTGTALKTAGRADYLSILSGRKSFVMLLAGIFLIFLVHNNVSSFKANILKELNADVSSVAFLNGATVLSEFPAMLLYGRFGKKAPGKWLALSLVFFLVKIVFITAAGSVGMLYAAFMLQSVSFGLYSPAIVDHIKARFPYEQTGRAQSLAANIPVAGSVIGALVVGMLLDHRPLRIALTALSVLTALGVVTALAALKAGQKEKNRPSS